MRRRLYYTDNQITKNLYTTGSEWQTADGQEYVGAYHTYVTGETYTEPDWNASKSKKLVEFKNASQTTRKYQELKSINESFEDLFGDDYVPEVIKGLNFRDSSKKTKSL